jgi:hypothetical protein
MNGDQTPLTQFLNIKDLTTFPGQLVINGAFAELFKRLIPNLNDGLNRWLILFTAILVNYVATLATKGLPGTAIAWTIFFMECIINGMFIALATLKAIELIVERFAREHHIERRKNGNGYAAPPPTSVKPRSVEQLYTQIRTNEAASTTTPVPRPRED